MYTKLQVTGLAGRKHEYGQVRPTQVVAVKLKDVLSRIALKSFNISMSTLFFVASPLVIGTRSG